MLITEQYKEPIRGVVSCYDRIIIRGTLPGQCFPQGMTAFLNTSHIRLFDYPDWAKTLNEAIHKNAEQLAAENGIEIEFIAR